MSHNGKNKFCIKLGKDVSTSLVIKEIEIKNKWVSILY